MIAWLINRLFVRPWQWVLAHPELAVGLAAGGFFIGLAVIAWTIELVGRVSEQFAGFLRRNLWVFVLPGLLFPPLGVFLTVAVLATHLSTKSPGKA